jgi:hypothetical protein
MENQDLKKENCKTCNNEYDVIFYGECMPCINKKKFLYAQTREIVAGVEEIQTIRNSQPNDSYTRRYNAEIRKLQQTKKERLASKKQRRFEKRKTEYAADHQNETSHMARISAEWNAVAEMMVKFYPNGIHKECLAVDYKILALTIYNLLLSVKA